MKRPVVVLGRHVLAGEPPRGVLGRRWSYVFAAAVLALSIVFAQPAEAQEPWIRDVIVERAEARGASAWVLTAVLRCESRFDPYAVGDYGRSHGIAQINDHPSTGLLGHFLSLGYRSAYSVWDSIDYLARVLAGDFWSANVRPTRWSCWRLLFGGGL